MVDFVRSRPRLRRLGNGTRYDVRFSLVGPSGGIGGYHLCGAESVRQGVEKKILDCLKCSARSVSHYLSFCDRFIFQISCGTGYSISGAFHGKLLIERSE